MAQKQPEAYNAKKDYCGPEGMGISKLIPRRLFGVSINVCCYFHDQGWSDGEGHKKADNQFRRDIQAQFDAEDKHGAGVVVSWVYFIAVRLGRAVLWLKGVR